MLILIYLTYTIGTMVYINIKDNKNEKVLIYDDKIKLVNQQDLVNRKLSMFTFLKESEEDGKKRGTIFFEDKNNKKRYLRLTSEKDPAALNETPYKICITPYKDKFIISNGSNKCLTFDKNKVLTAKCNRDNNKQMLNLTFFSRQGDHKEGDSSDLDKIHIDRTHKKVKKGSGVAYTDDIDVYFEPRAEKHQHKAKRGWADHSSDEDFVYVKKPAHHEEPEEHSDYRLVAPHKRQVTKISEKPATLRENIIADVIEKTVHTVSTTTTTQVLKKVEVVTAYEPTVSTTVVQVPEERILSPVYVAGKNISPRKDSQLMPTVEVDQQKPKTKYKKPQIKRKPVKRRLLKRNRPREADLDDDSSEDPIMGRKKPRKGNMADELAEKTRSKKRKSKRLNRVSDSSDDSGFSEFAAQNSDDSNSDLTNIDSDSDESTDSFGKRRRAKTKRRMRKEKKTKPRYKLEPLSFGKRPNLTNRNNNIINGRQMNNNYSQHVRQNGFKQQQAQSTAFSPLDRVMGSNSIDDSTLFGGANLAEFKNELKGTHIEALLGSGNQQLQKQRPAQPQQASYTTIQPVHQQTPIQKAAYVEPAPIQRPMVVQQQQHPVAVQKVQPVVQKTIMQTVNVPLEPQFHAIPTHPNPYQAPIVQRPATTAMDTIMVNLRDLQPRVDKVEADFLGDFDDINGRVQQMPTKNY